MNRREKEVKERYEAEGWKVLRNGAPDFVCLKVDGQGTITDVMGVEVKPPGGRLSYEQEVYRKIFEWAQARYHVEVVR